MSGRDIRTLTSSADPLANALFIHNHDTLIMTQKRNWRRKAIQNRHGEMVAVSDHWQLLDTKGRLLGEIYKSRDSQQWIWTVNVNPEGFASGISGAAPDGREAKGHVENKIPLGTVHHETVAELEHERRQAIWKRKIGRSV
jgi:hypothetical protein